MVIASNPRQANLQRMPTGWLALDHSEHNCPLCSRAALSRFQSRR